MLPFNTGVSQAHRSMLGSNYNLPIAPLVGIREITTQSLNDTLSARVGDVPACLVTAILS